MSLAASLRTGRWGGHNRGTPPPVPAVPARGPPGRWGRRCPALRGWKRNPKFPVNPFWSGPAAAGGAEGGQGWSGDPQLGVGVPGAAAGGPPLSPPEQSLLPPPPQLIPPEGNGHFCCLKRLFLKRNLHRGPPGGLVGGSAGVGRTQHPLFPGFPAAPPLPGGRTDPPPR